MKKKIFYYSMPIFFILTLLTTVKVSAFSDSTLTFFTNFAQALEAAEESGKSIVIEFYDKKSESVRFKSNDSNKNKIIDLFSSDLILLKIDALKDVNKLAKQYDVKLIPTFIVTDSKGDEIDRIVGFVEAEDFISQVTNYIKGTGTLKDLIEKANTSKNRELYFKIFKKYYDRNKKEEALKWMNRVIEDGQPNDSLSGRARFAIADMLKIERDFKSAIEAYQKIKTDFKGTAFDELASINIPFIAINMGDSTLALAGFKKFVSEFPNSENVGYAKNMIEQLTQ